MSSLQLTAKIFEMDSSVVSEGSVIPFSIFLYASGDKKRRPAISFVVRFFSTLR